MKKRKKLTEKENKGIINNISMFFSDFKLFNDNIDYEILSIHKINIFESQKDIYLFYAEIYISILNLKDINFMNLINNKHFNTLNIKIQHENMIILKTVFLLNKNLSMIKIN